MPISVRRRIYSNREVFFFNNYNYNYWYLLVRRENLFLSFFCYGYLLLKLITGYMYVLITVIFNVLIGRFHNIKKSLFVAAIYSTWYCCSFLFYRCTPRWYVLPRLAFCFIAADLCVWYVPCPLNDRVR